MKIQHLMEGVEPKMPGAPGGIQIMTPQQFVAKAGDMPGQSDWRDMTYNPSKGPKFSEKLDKMKEDDEQGVAEGNLKEFAPDSGDGESGRWYTDDQMTDLVGDGWWEDMDVAGNISKQQMIQQAQAWLDDQGYSVQVLNAKLNDDDMDWFIQGSFYNPNFAKKGVAEGLELNAMRKAAGLPVVEGRMLDESGETLSHIMDRFKHEVDEFEKGGDLDNDLYYALFDYYSDHGEIPYGVAKGRDGDPFEWVTDRLDRELGTGNYAPRVSEADALNTFEVMSGFDAPVAEGSCNMTAEGEYCPEHALAECGMYEMGTVAGSVAPVIGESNNSDALLARIKSLALVR